MTIRERIEEREKSLSEYAQLSVKSAGRENPEEEDPVRTCYMKDRDKIIHSPSFKALKGKTQVFTLMKDSRVMDRMTHTMEVAQIARTIAAALFLNETLTEAIALGHDCAHTCFGHAGESALSNNSVMHGGQPYDHAQMGYRRLNILNRLNLTREVIDGISRHSGLSKRPKACTLEGQIVQYADKIAYLTSDMENAIQMGVISGVDAYPSSVRVLGCCKSKIIDTLVNSVINASEGQPFIQMEDSVYDAFVEFREFSFTNIYKSHRLEDANIRCKLVVDGLYQFFYRNPDKIPGWSEGKDRNQEVVDYIASLTDAEAIAWFTDFCA